tara:strand:- start:1584 stop:1712 length:129 start_codon:yes stop_codon:yes gene_type:complete
LAFPWIGEHGGETRTLEDVFEKMRRRRRGRRGKMEGNTEEKG